MVPTRLLDAGFEFQFPDWPSACVDLVAKVEGGGLSPPLWTARSSSAVGLDPPYSPPAKGGYCGSSRRRVETWRDDQSLRRGIVRVVATLKRRAPSESHFKQASNVDCGVPSVYYGTRLRGCPWLDTGSLPAVMLYEVKDPFGIAMYPQHFILRDRNLASLKLAYTCKHLSILLA